MATIAVLTTTTPSVALKNVTGGGSISIANDKTVDGTGTGAFTSLLFGVLVATTYYVRAYATNAIGTAYGNEVTVIVPVVSPVISNLSLCLDFGLSPLINRYGGSISNLSLALDFGLTPAKNFYGSSVISLAIAVEPVPDDVMTYRIHI